LIGHVHEADVGLQYIGTIKFIFMKQHSSCFFAFEMVAKERSRNSCLKVSRFPDLVVEKSACLAAVTLLKPKMVMRGGCAGLTLVCAREVRCSAAAGNRCVRHKHTGPVLDISFVRLEAQEAISQFAGSAYLEERTIKYIRSESFNSFDTFVDRVKAADKSRRDIVREKRSEVLGAFEYNSSFSEISAFVLEQPSRGHFFLENRRAVYDRNRTHRVRRSLCGTAALR
jgi:hypothetical protein